MIKVYNKGIRPIVWKVSRQGKAVIHPGKFDILGDEIAKEIIKNFPDACTEEDYKRPQEGKKAVK